MHPAPLFGGSTLVMGIVNVTPDSFHDGGEHATVDAAVQHALRLVEDGADVLDIGGESTRPGAAEISAGDEMARVIPVIEELAKRNVRTPISVDTWKASVAAKAVEVGATWINDISGGVRDPEILPLVASSGAVYVCMHMRGTPSTMTGLTDYDDLLGEMKQYFEERLTALEAVGGSRRQVVLDPGIGFAKTPAQNYTLLARLDELRSLNQPLLVGASRKSFLKLVGVEQTEDRLPGSIAAATVAALAGVEVVRVHDVAETVQAVAVGRRIRQEKMGTQETTR